MDYRAVVTVYWPTREFLKPLSRSQWESFSRERPVEFERFIDATDTSVRLVRDGSRIDPAFEQEVHTERGVKARLLRLIEMAIHGAPCISVVPRDFGHFPKQAQRAFRWISNRLGIFNNGPIARPAVLQSIPDDDSLVPRLMKTLPVTGKRWFHSFDHDVPQKDRATWGDLVIESDVAATPFSEWYYHDTELVTTVGHRNQLGQALSYVFSSGPGGVVLIPEVLPMKELLSVLVDLTGKGYSTHASPKRDESTQADLSTRPKRAESDAIAVAVAEHPVIRNIADNTAALKRASDADNQRRAARKKPLGRKRTWNCGPVFDCIRREIGKGMPQKTACAMAFEKFRATGELKDVGSADSLAVLFRRHEKKKLRDAARPTSAAPQEPVE